MKAEDDFDFAKALEYYEKAFDELSIEDGSLQRYANLLFEFQEYEKAKEIFEIIVQKTNHSEYLEKLAQIYEELELKDQAINIYERLGQIDRISQLKNQKRTSQIDDIVIKKFLDLFSGREDVFAIQMDEGYYPVRLPMKEKDVLEHLNGEKTLGLYVLRSDNNIKFAAFDIDFKKGFENNYQSALRLCRQSVMNICEKLKIENIKYHVEFSGNRGYHIWIFFDRWLQAYKVRFILRKIVESISIDDQISVEIFPKQSDTGGGLGNLIKLPLGIHRKTKNRCPFVDENFEPVHNQYDYLLKIEPNDSDVIEKLYKEFSQEQNLDLQATKQKQKNIDAKPSSQVKRVLRQEIKPITRSNLLNTMIQACYPLKQIYEKIQKLGYINEDEEYIIIAACVAMENSKEFLSDLFKKTINYSQSRLHALMNRVGTIPITCEEIKRIILSKSLALNIDQCNCKFNEVLNTPLCLVTNLDFFVLPNIDLRDIVRKIMDKTKEKAELENQIRTLKNLLAQKMTVDEINIEDLIIRKKDGEIQIII
ncbi:MAG TPA: CRISPR-associated primase-polymerase type A1 [Pseudothermotoga sp.]|uniref:CRISPR-associated primase-polymerase type A1 n=1 Tax=Thermotoga profunda TaxID=1508420 RepID=UPI000596B63A|nr:CRISPR-associated primase-polymerase type A1 [Thermotoga profunda]